MSQTQFNQRLLSFLEQATTPFHAVEQMVLQLEAAGFRPLSGAGNLQAGQRYYLTRNDSSLLAFIIGSDAPPATGMRMVGAHTDSPCLMVKPRPEKLRSGYFQLGVEVYGGALLNPWFDRDLSLAGRVSFAGSGGQLRTALVDFRQPLAVIPSLAIHLDREANQNRSVNPQTDILPVLAIADGQDKPDFRDLLAGRLREEYPGLEVGRILDYELSFYDSQPAALVGLGGDFIASARLDNLLSCFTGMDALLQADGTQSCLLVCNDHEEVGSLSTAGAQGPLLLSTLRRIAGSEEQLSSLVQASMMISADNAHGLHPNYADRHDDNHGPRLNAGPVIKVNANQRYATNAETAGFFRLLAEREQVPVQSFVVRTDMACGSTIGPITAGGTGIRTLDIGVPTFAMHSIRELAGSEDAANLARVLQRFYNHQGSLTPA
ncbi:M18 family aminopeptidase [Kineobactrum salinum]|uniref:M18 family aminopeptidase n=1 Tax=Kineobactrum salinum TaxID=2708301 RepID=A0A6C0TXA7_9GAMM|nr:M18 family aminopeptidase [Kineobactrum salinum]QIB64470.1 M18 family aminopeptidase [Kineobactrum salinum]